MLQQLAINSLVRRIVDWLCSKKRELRYGIHDYLRLLTQQEALSRTVNQKEIRVVGLQRTGNHAITNWIIKQQTSKVRYLNNIPAQKNPYRCLYQHYPRERLRREALGDFGKNDCLIYCYEDYALDQIVTPQFEEKHDFVFGKSAARYDVLLLRDPFNLIASRIKSNNLSVKSPNRTIVELWIAYAQEYLGETNFLKNNKVFINYNKWFSNIDYRRHLASLLDLEFTDAGVNDVKPQGGGNSFEKQEFDGQANRMKVLDRWKSFIDNPLFQEWLNNRELIDYSERIFGHIPETEDFCIK